MSAEAHTGAEDPADVTEEQRQRQRQQQQQGDDVGFSLWRGVEMARRSGSGRGWWAPFSPKKRGDRRRVYDELPADVGVDADGIGDANSPADEVALPLSRSFDSALEIDGDVGEERLASGPVTPSISSVRGGCCRRLTCCACTCVALLVVSLVIAVSTVKMRTMTSMPPDPPVSPDCPAIDDGANVVYSPRDLDLNRVASILSPAERERHFLHSAHFAFAWNDGDGNTQRWRPQGITTVTLPAVDAGEGMDVVNATGSGASVSMGRRKFVLVSWYGRRDEGYLNRGGRVTFVDVSEADKNATGEELLRYRHVLLVDSEFRTFPGLHLGGLSYDPLTGRLLVPDSRPIIGRKILLFDLPGGGGGGGGNGASGGLFRVPECRRTHFFGYAYVWRESGRHDVSIKPSFIDYDPDRTSHVVGTFSHCPGTGNAHSDSDGCLSIEQNHILWLTEGGGGENEDGDNASVSTATAAVTATETATCYPFFSDMQGAASARVSLPDDDGDGGGRRGVLWVSSSYGAVVDSHLHGAYFDPDVDCPVDDGRGGDGGGFVLGDYRTVPYPPGLEDLHLEEVEDDNGEPTTTSDVDGTDNVDDGGRRRNMWMLTEYHPRLVWATRVEHLLPL